ncbi:amidase [Aurantimonas sp. A2-1-M11]|uniref:amidase n=1 Tax=Aurantimonas sp. A2-1-M11 TaxID=3113712 RepID=UPI002F9479D7
MADLWKEGACALSEMLERREISPLDLLDESLLRIKRMEPVLNAFAYLDPEGAREAAVASAKRQADGARLGPLDGIPVSVKDNLYVAGMPGCWGSLLLEGYMPPQDDICVERLKAGGAIIVGKTTTPEFALMGRTESRLTGSTRNPWDPSLTPGGSSGGAVATVASGMVPLALGTDAGGSTRMPASYTGIIGLRGSNGRVPRCYGFPPMALDFQSVGLFCRTMADLDLLLSVLGRADPRDPASLLLPPISRESGSRRVGWFVSIGKDAADDEVIAAHAEAKDALVAAGHQVTETDPPFDFNELLSLWEILTAVGAARAAESLQGNKELLTDQIVGLLNTGSKVSGIDYVRVLDRLQAFRRETSSRWGGFDALLLPSTASPAFDATREAPETIGGRPGSGPVQGMFCGWVNAMGYCGLNVPGRPHPDGRPIGLQIVVPAGRDNVALQIGRELEAALPWADRWPPAAMA